MPGSLVSDSEKLARLELGSKIYRIGEKIRMNAFRISGLGLPTDLYPRVEVKGRVREILRATIKTVPPLPQATASENDIRGISTNDGSHHGGYFQPDGSVWRMDAAPLGFEWQEHDASMNELSTMAGHLEMLARMPYSVEIIFSGNFPGES